MNLYAEVLKQKEALARTVRLIEEGGVEVDAATRKALARDAQNLLDAEATLKAKHDGRKDVATGKFHSMDRTKQTKVGGLVLTHNDTRQHLARDFIAAGKREPSGGGDEAGPHAAYDGDGNNSGEGQGDPQGLKRKEAEWLG